MNGYNLKNIVLYAMLLIVSFMVMYYNQMWGSSCLGLSIIIIIVNFISGVKEKKSLSAKIFAVRQEVEAAQVEKLYDLPIPVALVNRFGMIVTNNVCFRSTFGINHHVTKGKYLHNVIKVRIDEIENGKPYSFTFKDNNYAIIDKQYKEKTGKMHLLTFIEVGFKQDVEADLMPNETVFGYIMIDNYDDMNQQFSPGERSSVFGKIDVLLSEWASSRDAIIQKYENDRYLVIMSREHLKVMENENFKILDQVRDVHAQVKVTLSIGIGISEKRVTFEELERLSKAAIDFAMARGGDQCVIRNDEKTTFFGGKTEAIEKRTKVKARVKGRALRELMYSSDNILIMGHVMPDMDCIGSAVGLMGAARSLNRDCRFVLKEVNDGISAMMKYLSKDEHYRNAFITPEEAETYIKEDTLLIVVDTQNKNYIEWPELLDKNSNLIVIDHHRRSGEEIGSMAFSYIETYASSTCELVAELLEYFDEKEVLNKTEANILLAGICMDTKMFTVKSGVRTFEAAAALKRKGADTVIAKTLLASDMASYAMKADAVRTAMIYNNIAISTMTGDNKNAKIIAAQAADELLNIKDITASFIILETENMYTISGRSMGEVNVQLILEKLGGGGHLTIAGAQLSDLNSMDEAKDRLIKAIEEYLQNSSAE